MIFADFEEQEGRRLSPYEMHGYLSDHFEKVMSGTQGDSWVWVFDGDDKVAIDTFTSMTYQIKADKQGPHVRKVIELLSLKYKLVIYDQPELEGHEGE